MADLPLFTDPAICSKCMNADIGATYDKGCGGFKGCSQHPERIERNCRRCGFKWDEAPYAEGRSAFTPPPTTVVRHCGCADPVCTCNRSGGSLVSAPSGRSDV